MHGRDNGGGLRVHGRDNGGGVRCIERCMVETMGEA